MYRKKKGTTLIEVVIYLALLSVLVLISFGSVNYFNNKANEILVENELLEIKNFLILKKTESKNRRQDIRVILKENYIFDRNNEADRVEFKDIKIVEAEKLEIVLSSNSQFQNGYKFVLKDKFEKEYKVEICKECSKVHIN